MKKTLVFRGAVVTSLFISWLGVSCCFAGDDRGNIERFQPKIVHEQDNYAGSITSKIKAKTRRSEVIVKKNELTGSPHSIIAAGLEVKDKAGMKDAITNLKSRVIDKKMRLKGEVLSAPQQKIDQAARRFIKDNKDILSTDESNLKLLNIQKVRSKAYVSYQQYYKDIPVYQAIVKVVISSQGKIPSLGADYLRI
ncbi:MAG: hypothetical protein V1709_02640 [Planctomycetota bacterium]